MKTYRFKIFGNEYETRIIRKTESEMVITVNDVQYKAHLETRRDLKPIKPTPKVERPAVARTSGTPVSAAPDKAFSERLRQAGFQVEEVRVAARGRRRGGRHTVWLAACESKP